MKVYVATLEPDHANSTVIGVARTLDGAKALAQRDFPSTAFVWTEHDKGFGESWWSSDRDYESIDIACFEVAG